MRLILDDPKVTTPEITDQIHEIILEDHRKCLNTDQKCQQCQSSEKLLEFFRRDPNGFLSGANDDHGRNLVISL